MNKPQRLDLHQLARDELRAVAAGTLVVVPLGATEQHGPHLAVGTDWLVVDRLAHDAASVASREIPVLVAPALPFGSSQHHLPFGGTISLSSWAFYTVLCDIVDSLVTDGFRRVFLLNGHGGNQELAQVAGRDAALKHEISVGVASWWQVASDALRECGAMEMGRVPGHAGAFETSVMQSLFPSLVSNARPQRPVPPDDGRRASSGLHHGGSWIRNDGYSDNPSASDEEAGHRFVEASVPLIAAELVRFYREAPNDES